MHKLKFLAAIFFLFSGCETIKPLKVQNTRHQSFEYISDPAQTTEKVIDFLLQKNFEIKIMRYNVISTIFKNYSNTIVGQERADEPKAYFIANCKSIECPVVTFNLTAQITANRVSIHYSNILATPIKYDATPTFRLVKELEDFLKN